MAEQLGVEEDLVEEIACMAMKPEDGRISIIDSNDDAPSVTAFTRDGIGYLGRSSATRRPATTGPACGHDRMGTLILKSWPRRPTHLPDGKPHI
ncbi:hypothetical protein M9979_14935 [Sphingomonas sp. RP10(2022)]|uniref:Uncharacterized protein n=1 Tax=Sphingomonas liriopis TaxID=2949094 RepID=A0A9X2KRZ7_9SPHN|nr:hypothetical protein [Sphingomonas liriopis]MCP3736166.1 hypothetical protein [Sphingomonas liriopis]